jgi:hypothetical protein
MQVTVSTGRLRHPSPTDPCRLDQCVRTRAIDGLRWPPACTGALASSLRSTNARYGSRSGGSVTLGGSVCEPAPDLAQTVLRRAASCLINWEKNCVTVSRRHGLSFGVSGRMMAPDTEGMSFGVVTSRARPPRGTRRGRRPSPNSGTAAPGRSSPPPTPKAAHTGEPRGAAARQAALDRAARAGSGGVRRARPAHALRDPRDPRGLARACPAAAPCGRPGGKAAASSGGAGQRGTVPAGVGRASRHGRRCRGTPQRSRPGELPR